VKRFSFITTLFLSLGLLSTAHAAGPDDSFIQAYTLIAEADNLSRLGQKNAAIQKYREARNNLAALQSGYPDWNTAVVSFRISYVDRKLKAIGAETPGEAKPATAKPAPLDPAAAQREIDILKRKVESLGNSIILKDAKLKEALSAVPTPEETNRLAKLESDLSGLRQENANLKDAIDKATAELKDANTGMAKARAEAEKAQADLANAQAETEKTNKALASAVKEAKTANAQANNREAKRLEKQLASKQESLEKTEKELASLRTANDTLESELKSFKKGSREKDLQAEVESLKKKMADGNNKFGKISGDLAALKNDNASLEEELKSFKKGSREKDLEAKVGSLEKKLAKSNSELKKASNSLATAENSNDSLNDQLKTLQKGSREKEMLDHINTLQRRLAKAERQNTNPASKRKGLTGIFSWRKEGRAEKAQVAELQNRIETLRARLEVLEAEKTPYTDEEKKLFAEPKTESPPANTLEAKVATLPEGAAAEFKAGQAALVKANFSEAEQKFMHVLKLDEENPLTLANLAMAQMEQGNYDGAEASLVRALQNDEQDAYSLSLMGTLRYRQKKYEEARDHLAKAVKLNPDDASTQQFLGLALKELGQRKAAETALRKAVQIKPGFAEAHHNLAVVYAMQKPPFIALAKFHYAKAVAGGYKKNADLEKILGAEK
jgi:Flp pilus assembly protein TadD